jgi:chromosome segregation ATPase
MNWLLDNWALILGTVTTPIAWIFGGKQAKKVEIKKANGDAVATMQSVYDQFLQDYKDRMNEVMSDLNFVKDHNRELQTQFNKIQLDYARETEVSNDWKQKYYDIKLYCDQIEKHCKELEIKVTDLEKRLSVYETDTK